MINELEEKDEILEHLTREHPEESAQAYAAFLHYVNLPPAERYAPDTMELIAEKFNLALLTIKNYRSIYEWTERMKLIDAHFARIQFKQRVKANEQHNLKFAQETREIQNMALKASRLALEVVNGLLENAKISGTAKETDFVKVLKTDGTTEVRPITTIYNFDTKLSDAAPLLRAAVETPGKVAGLPVETVPIETHTMEGATEGRTKAELEERLKTIRKEKGKITQLGSVD